MSEQGYMHRRVQVEVAWLIALSDAGFAEFKPLSPGARTYLLGLVKTSPRLMRLAIKEIEKTTNHDVKAVEYWIKSKFEARPELLAGQRVCALCLHQRRHQQHQPCPATQAPGATWCCCPRWTP
jgi:adenylosuccinate lyase